MSSASGRLLKPKEKPNLVFYIKALNVVKPDKWGTCELIAFLEQLLTYEGYYDENLEWISLENIQVCSRILGIIPLVTFLQLSMYNNSHANPSNAVIKD